MIQYQKLCTYDVWTESQKKCRFRGLTESKSDDKNFRQSAIFYQILLKFELNQIIYTVRQHLKSMYPNLNAIESEQSENGNFLN